MLEDLRNAKVVKQTDLNGEKAYQVIAKWNSSILLKNLYT
jgi:hypothetical protein